MSGAGSSKLFGHRLESALIVIGTEDISVCKVCISLFKLVAVSNSKVQHFS